MRHLAPRLAILAVLLGGSAARACNVPVFRYGLEHWAAEPYQATLYHRGPLDTADLARIDTLEKASPAQVRFHSVDLGQQTVEDAPAQLPWLIVRYPASANKTAPIWQGPLSDEAAANLLDSPCRHELARRLLAGDTAVWVLLESENDTIAANLEAWSRRIETTLKLPVLTHSAEDRIRDDVVPLRLSFSVLRVSRTDPAERLFVRMLLSSEPDLDARSGPLVFPVFGRGRLLYALAGAGITEANLTKAAEFLIGACSCKVKEAHPGVDLLLSADWPAAPDDSTLSGGRTVEMDTAEPQSVPLPTAKTRPAPVTASIPASDTPEGRHGWLIGAILGAALLTLVTGRLAWRRNNRRLRG